MPSHDVVMMRLRTGTWAAQQQCSEIKPLPIPHYVECITWLALSVLCLLFREPIAVVAALMFLRLISLGATGAFLIFFSGQCLVVALENSLNVRISALGTTALTASALSVFHIVRFKGPIDRTAQRDCVLIGVWACLVLYLLYRGYGIYPDDIQDRFKLLTVQSGALLLLTYHFAQDTLDPRKIEKGMVLVISSVFLVMGSFGLGFFERMYGVPPIELARAGGLASVLIFILAMSGRSGTQRTVSLCFAAVGLLACLSQLTRQAVYAIPVAVVGTLLLFDRRKRLRMWAPLILMVVVCLGSLPLWYGPVAAKLDRVFQNPEDALSTRQDHYQTSWMMFRNRPWTGYGFGGYADYSFVDNSYPHNIVLEILCEFGLRGLAVAAFPFLLGLWSSYEMRQRKLSLDQYLGTTIMIAVLLYWITVSMASYSLPHSCVCMPAMYLLVIERRRIGMQAQSRR